VSSRAVEPVDRLLLDRLIDIRRSIADFSTKRSSCRQSEMRLNWTSQMPGLVAHPVQQEPPCKLIFDTIAADGSWLNSTIGFLTMHHDFSEVSMQWSLP